MLFHLDRLNHPRVSSCIIVMCLIIELCTKLANNACTLFMLGLWGLSPSSVMLLNCYTNALLRISIPILYNMCVMLAICFTLFHGTSGCLHVMVMVRINMSDTGSMNSSDGRLVKY
jgi:hypothetical protein